MALVAYDNSDSSEFEEEEEKCITILKAEEPSTSKTHLVALTRPGDNVNIEELNDLGHGDKLFNLLPQPTKKTAIVVEDDDEFLHKKETTTTTVKPKARITVPSLNEFKDVEHRPNVKPKLASEKKSGLLSILPEPKNGVKISTKSLIPHVLTKKSTTVIKQEETPVIANKPKSLPTGLVNHYSDESDNDDEVQNDFFSINKPIEIPIVDAPLDIEPSSSDKQSRVNISTQKIPTRNIQSYFKRDEPENNIEFESNYAETSNSDTGQPVAYQNGYGVPESSNSQVLDEEAILKLCGSRGKRKREEIQIVDVRQQDVLADAREWMLKGLMDDTSKRVSSSKKKGNEPSSQQRRKHQITYLAHQAKANEAELQNQWANNRVTKRQTQSKYGF